MLAQSQSSTSTNASRVILARMEELSILSCRPYHQKGKDDFIGSIALTGGGSESQTEGPFPIAA